MRGASALIFDPRSTEHRSRQKSRKEWRWEPTTFVFPLNRSPQNQWVRLRDWSVRRVEVPAAPPGIFEGMVYFPYLPPKAELTADLELCFERRGRYCESKFWPGHAVSFRFPYQDKAYGAAAGGSGLSAG